MVQLGVEETARNTASVALAECVVDASGVVGDERFDGRARRERLAPGETWEWDVTFGDEADAQDRDVVEDVRVTTRAEYAE